MHNPIIYKEIGINIISPTTSVCDHSSFPKEENRDRIDFLITPPIEILPFDSFFIRIHFSFERNKLETTFFLGLIPKLPHPSHITSHIPHMPPHTSPPPHRLPPLHPTRTVPRPTFFSVKRAPATER